MGECGSPAANAANGRQKFRSQEEHRGTIQTTEIYGDIWFMVVVVVVFVGINPIHF